MANARLTLCVLALVAAALAASGMAEVVHNTPRSELKKRVPTYKPNGGDGGGGGGNGGLLPSLPRKYVPIFDREQQEYLKAHNDLRRKVGVPPLQWSPTLAAEAHAWAEHRRGDCDYRHHSGNRHGENIYWKSYKEFRPADVVQWWFDEYKLYDNIRHACKCWPERNGCECGHYLAVVWSATKQVGCSGAIYCDGQKGVYVVCQYDPPASLQPGLNPLNAKWRH